MAASDFAAQAKLSREQVRSQNKGGPAGDHQQMADLTEKESAAELLLEAKGFENVIVNLTGGNGRHRSAGSRPKRCQKGTDRGHCKAQNRNRPGEHCDHAAEREHGRLCR